LILSRSKIKNPLVSVVIPTYQQAEFLPACLQSVLDQTYPHLEIVVVNDGSTDATYSILEEFAKKDSRLRILNQNNLGFAQATNRAIEQAKGEYLAHTDSDDLLHPEKIERQLEFLQTNDRVDIVHTALDVIDKRGNSLMILRGEDVDPKTFLAKMLFRSIVSGPATLMGKREDLLTAPYRDKFKISEDYDRVLRLAVHYRFGYLDLPLTKWRRHEKNLTNDLNRCKNAQFEILKEYDVKRLLGFVEAAQLPEDEKLVLKGNVLYNLQMWKEALEYFEHAESAAGYFYGANCLMQLNDPKKAVTYYKKSLKVDPNDAACWNNLGVATKERSHFEKALEICPQYLDAQYNLTHDDYHLTERKLREALIPYIRSTASTPKR
jgi:glycosyltransferase involved in cell wall biosynthesis